MEVIVLQVFVSLVLVLSALVLFAYTVRQRDGEHADRLCLLPIEDDAVARGDEPISPAPTDTASSAAKTSVSCTSDVRHED